MQRNCYLSAKPMKKIFISFLTLVAVLVAVLILRTATFNSRQIHASPIAPIDLDQDKIVQRLVEAIRIKTISFQSPGENSAKEFQRFHRFLSQSFPRVNAQLTKQTVNDYSLLYAWKGKDEQLKPILLLAHMDVVPVDVASEKSWTHPPFSGQIADGYIWGRGAMDDKASLLGILEAVEYLLSQGVQPQRTIYLAFGHDEEIGGSNGAAKIAELLRAKGVELEFILDEGMGILRGLIDGLTSPVALIGIAEKGYLSVQLTAESPGGHSSIPPDRTAIGVVSRALQRLEETPFAATLRGPTRLMFEFLGPELSWTRRLMLANLWLFEPLVTRQLSQSPLTNAVLRTTVAPTIFQAGVRDNILPAQASAIINLRMLPGDTTAGTLAQIQKIIDDPEVKLVPLADRMEPSPVSDVESPSFKVLQRSIAETAPHVVIAPSLFVAGSDSRRYAALTKNVFRFSPITLSPEDAKRYHGVGERISIEDYERCVRFYVQLIRNSQQ
jgi:carboxypeptidase PM20D1